MTGQLAVPRIDLKNIYRYLGYREGKGPTPRILSLIMDYTRNINKFIDRSYSYVIKEIEGVEESMVFIEGGIEFESTVLAALFERCTKVGLFVVTIGGRLENVARSLANEGLVLRAHILDSLGSDDLARDIAIGRLTNKGCFSTQ
jgi:hypothetical protein